MKIVMKDFCVIFIKTDKAKFFLKRYQLNILLFYLLQNKTFFKKNYIGDAKTRRKIYGLPVLNERNLHTCSIENTFF